MCRLRVKLKQGLIPSKIYGTQFFVSFICLFIHVFAKGCYLDPFFVPKRLKVVRSHPHLFDKLLDMKKVESSPGAYEFDTAAVVRAMMFSFCI